MSGKSTSGAKTGTPAIPLLKWSVARAACEFGSSKETIHKRMASASIVPDSDGFYNTRQICAAIFGDYSSERLRKMRADAELAEIELGAAKNELIPADQIYRALSVTFLAIKQTVLGSALDSNAQDDILRTLADFDLLLADAPPEPVESGPPRPPTRKRSKK